MMNNNNNGARYRICLPDTFTIGDQKNLCDAVENHNGLDQESMERLQAFLQLLATPYAEACSAPIIDPDQPRIYRLGDLLEEWDTFAQEAYDAKQGNKPLGITTGLDKVDEAIGGAFQPGLHSLQGGPGVGKTAFALQVAAACDFPALYVTCEMTPLELLRRIAARVTGTFLGKFKSGELTPEQSKEHVCRAIVACQNVAILDLTRGYAPAFASGSNPDELNLYDLADTLRGDYQHVLIVVDSLHSYADKAQTEAKEYDYLNTAIGSLRSLAAALNCPVLSIAERNRQGMETGGISAGAGTRKIEYSAESVMELNSVNDIPDASGELSVILKLSKNRNGIIGRPIELRFNGAIQRFREV
ncbi:MAG: AAA family ATPase [Armatimonadetes bacterium]|nr:AAA family ATPase [Armatimonadota bacterium]